MLRKGETMNTIWKCLGPIGIIAVLLGIWWFSHHPVDEAKRAIREFNKITTKSVAITILQDVQKLNHMKVFRCRVGGFLDKRAHNRTANDPKAKEVAGILYQWEGQIDYIQALGPKHLSIKWSGIQDDGVRKIDVHLRYPHLDSNTRREWIDRDFPGFRCKQEWNTLGHQKDLRKLKNAIGSYVTEAIDKAADTETNRKAAQEQSERVLRALFASLVNDPEGDITFTWYNKDQKVPQFKQP